MATTTRKQSSRRAVSTLSDAELEQLMALLEEADSVELKLTVPAAAQRSTVTALGLDPVEAQIRQVFFFDTPDLALDRRGVVVRVRRVQGKGDDSVVKLRPVVPDELPDDVRKAQSFVIEVDAMPGGFVCSGSMKRSLGTKDVRAAVNGKRPLRKLFSKEQRAFFDAYAPDGITLDDLTILGPIFVLKLKFGPRGFDRKLVAEMWLYPDNSRVLELSTKCPPSDTFQAAADSRRFLAESGIDLSGEQQTKTRNALRVFAKEAAAT